MLRQQDYERIMQENNVPHGKNEQKFTKLDGSVISIMQTSGSNKYLYTLASHEGVSSNEVLVADVLLSSLILANKASFFAWKGMVLGRELFGDEWKTVAWPVQSFNFIPYLKIYASRVHLVGVLSRHDVARRKWIAHILKILQGSAILAEVLGIKVQQDHKSCIVEFSRETLDGIATKYLPSALDMPCTLYKFPSASETKCLYSFYANRALCLHFKASQEGEGEAWPKRITRNLKRLLALLALPTLEAWQMNPMSAVRRRTATNWYYCVVQNPIQHYGLFTSELDSASGAVTITRQFRMKQELEEVGENG